MHSTVMDNSLLGLGRKYISPKFRKTVEFHEQPFSATNHCSAKKSINLRETKENEQFRLNPIFSRIIHIESRRV